jgi:hypothetical protein
MLTLHLRSRKTLTEQALLGITLLSSLLSFASLIIALNRQSPTLAIVDIQALIQHQSQQLAQGSSKGTVNLKELRQTARQMKNFLEIWAKRHQTILLAKGSVWGSDLEDVTPQLATYLADQSRDR